MIYSETVRPRLSDFSRNGRLSCEAVLEILETAGSHHSDFAQDSLIRDPGSSAVWILADWRVRFLRPAGSQDVLNVSTWLYQNSPAGMTLRGYLVTDGGGNELVRAEARCALINLGTGRLVRVDKALFDAYQPEEKTAFDAPAPRLAPPEKYDAEKTVRLRADDLDFNGHVHNTRYVSLAAELCPELLDAAAGTAGLRILYRKPVQNASEAAVKRTDRENGCMITVFCNGELCTLFELEMI